MTLAALQPFPRWLTEKLSCPADKSEEPFFPLAFTAAMPDRNMSSSGHVLPPVGVATKSRTL